MARSAGSLFCAFFLWALFNHDTIVYQFSFHASPISCPVPTNMWRFLDPLPVSSQFRVRLFCVYSLLLTLTRGNTEKAKNKTQRTPISSPWTTTLTAAMSRSLFPFLELTFKYYPQPSYSLYFVSLAPPSPQVLPVQNQTRIWRIYTILTFLIRLERFF